MYHVTITELLQERSNTEDIGITFIEKSTDETFLSYKDLYARALKVLSSLQKAGMRPKDELVFQIDDNQTMIIVFWACILGGLIPVPVSVGHNDGHRQKLFNIWTVLNNPYLIISTDKWSKLVSFAQERGVAQCWLDMERKRLNEIQMLTASDDGYIHQAKENEIAFIQFSSGSTGDPKGVMLTHANLIANLKAISWAAGYTNDDSMMSWMPLTHDMGMIGFHLNPLFCNMNQYLMPTTLFIRRPSLWLDKVSEHGVSILCSPNFGFKYVLKHAKPDEGIRNLSRVRLLYNGAEPISLGTCREFLTYTRKHGLREGVMRPVYGLAEASLAVSISRPGDEVMALHLDRKHMNFGERILEKPPGADAVPIVNVGEAIAYCSIRITNHQDEPLEDQTIGHVQIKGSNVTAGYYNNFKETQKISGADGWLRTGDLGFIRNNALFITGRAKDIIFLNGQNYYPYDIERIAEAAEGVELNTISIAGFFDHLVQREKTVAFILHRGDIAAFIPVAQSVRSIVNGKVGFELDHIIPVKDIPRTTSGKLQRFKLLEAYQNGSFREVEQQLNQLLVNQTAGASSPEKPANDNEQKLLSIWKSILENDGIGVDHKFFEYGGNSLRASELAMALVKEFGVYLPFNVLYEKQTIRELASELAQLEQQEYRPIPTIVSDGYHPASSAQCRLYYACQVDPTTIGYNTPVAFWVEGEMVPARLEECIHQLIARHDTLRMSFGFNREPVFTLHDPVDFTLSILSCSWGELDSQLRSLVKPFDLKRPPLFRSALITVDRQRCVLFLDFHHIITDGLSVAHFIGELCRLYNGEELLALTTGYKEYVYWEKQTLESVELKRHEVFWLQYLSEGLPALKMPLDWSRPATFSYAGARVEFGLDSATTRQLREFATAQDMTLNVLLFTVYNLLLSKYTGQHQIVVGIPVFGRWHPDLQAVQGMFVNNLAVITKIDGKEPFDQLLVRQRENMEQVLLHQKYPFDMLVGKVGEKRDVSRNPVFDSMFVYQNIEVPRVEGTPFTLSPCFFDPGYAKFDISLEIFERGESISGGFEYATTLFRRETILRLTGHYKNLIKQVLLHPNRAVSDLSLLGDDECDEIRTFNNTRSSFPVEKTIHQLVEEQVVRSPTATALVYNQETMTYKELGAAADNLAQLMREKGVGPGHIVAVVLERTPALLISILGILKAGGCYLPVDTDLPEERVRYMITDSGCRVVITDGYHVGHLATSLGADMCVINAERLDAYPASTAVIQNVNVPSDLAYVIYTSGTTGQPKGVMIEHRTLVNYTTWAASQYVQGEAAAFPLFTSISFDLTITSIFTPLITGNCIVLYRERGEMSLEKIICDNKTEVIKLTPSHLRMLRDVTIPSATKIKRFIVGGEQLETQLARQIYNKFGGNIALYNEYGPTEATVGCMTHIFDPNDAQLNVPIGVPAANTQVYLLDSFQQPVPTGVTGELYLSGACIARGYLFRDELTHERFVPDPFVAGQRMYKTGDFARRLPNGLIEYIGRSDQQLKINGYRIELAEIEYHLLSHPEVTGAVVAPAGTHHKLLNAYYTGTNGNYTEESALKNYLASRLPHYMIPARFRRLENIPLTRNGKTDYNALSKLGEAETETKIQLPASELETVFLAVWEEVLGAAHLRVTDNFFELGGDSIKAVQIASRLIEKGISIHVRHILTYHTIAQISPHASTVPTDNYEQGIAVGKRVPSPIESWFLDQHFVNPSYYNQTVLLYLNQQVDIRRLEKVFQNLITHHDGLRLNYDVAQNVFFYNNQHLETGFTIEEIAVESLDINSGKPESLFISLKNTFDITRSLLLKAAFIRETGGAEMLFITAHHLITDGVSWRILLEDLHHIYTALEMGETATLPRKTGSLVDWARELDTYGRLEARHSEEAYWAVTEKVDFVLPQDFTTDDWRFGNRRMVIDILDEENTGFLLKEAHKAYKTDAQTLLITALSLALREWTGVNQLIIELENHGRHLESIDVSRTVGWFTVMYPAKLELSGDKIGNHIKAVKEQLRNVPGKGIGYGLQRKGNCACNLTPVRFNYLGQFDRELNNDLFSYSSRPTGPEADPENAMTTRLEFNAMVVGGVLHLEIQYNLKAHRESTINHVKQAFFGHLTSVLDHIRNECEVHFTPSDFQEAGLNDEDLAALFG